MRAALLESPGKQLTIVDDVVVDPPRSGEVRVRVAACGLCHSDMSVLDAPALPIVPIIVGHEAAGVVESIGDHVVALAPGDHVVLTPSATCGRCYWCLRGEASLCVNFLAVAGGTFGDGTTRLSWRDKLVYRGLGVGAFAELVVTKESGAIKIPDDVPLDMVCVIGCAVQTGVGAVINTAKVRPGETVLVMGLGGVGLAIVQGARLAGASVIVASDPICERRNTAEQLGATHSVDPQVSDVVDYVRQSTIGIGADYAFDAVGSARLVELGLQATRRGGTVVCVGGAPDAITISPGRSLMNTEKTLKGSLLGGGNSQRDIPILVELARSGRLDLQTLITKRRPLDEINDALDDLRNGQGIRTVLTS